MKLESSSRELNFDYFSEVLGDDEGMKEFARIPAEEMTKKSWITDKLDALWLENYDKNKPDLKPYPIKDLSDKTAILVGASPAIRRNAHLLKDISDDFVVIACNTVLKYLREIDVKPDFVFAVEGNHHIESDFDCKTDDLVLIASPFVSHKAWQKWDGEKYNYFIGGGRKFDKLLRKEWDDVDCGGGNVVSTSFLWAYKFLKIRHFILIGMSLAYYDEYYHDGREKPGEDVDFYRDKYQALDIYGQAATTTPALCMYKTWFETYTKYAIKYGGGSFTNSTEDGILGVLPEMTWQDPDNPARCQFKPRFLPWLNVVPLSTAIEGHQTRMKETKHGSRN